MSLHDVSTDESAVRAVHSVKVVVIVDHILTERIRSMAVFHRVSTVDEVPLYHKSTVSIQYWVTAFHLKCNVTLELT